MNSATTSCLMVDVTAIRSLRLVASTSGLRRSVQVSEVVTAVEVISLYQPVNLPQLVVFALNPC